MARPRTLRTEAIVLRRSDFGEADRLLTLYSPDHGKLRAIAKGARKPQSRKTGHVELFMRSTFLLAIGRDLYIVTQAELIEAYAALRNSLVQATYAGYLVELLDKFVPENEANRTLYALLADSLARLEDDDSRLLALRYYELRLLALVGLQPQLFRCVVTGGEIEERDHYFSADLGGLIVPGYEKADRGARRVSAAAIKVMRYLQTRPWDTVRFLQLRPALHREIELVLHDYLEYQLEKRVQSAEFLYRLRREAIDQKRSQNPQ